ncbi:MAG: hypothetical protein ACJLS2_03810 [Microcella pacifica]
MPVSRFESPLTGGHPNSLGNTVSVVDEVLADRALLAELVACYRSEDAVVRLRVLERGQAGRTAAARVGGGSYR